MNANMINQDEHKPRNKDEAILDCKYGRCFNDLNARLYRRMGSAFSVVNLIGGSAAFTAAISGSSAVITVIAALAILFVTVLDHEIRPGEKSILCENQRQRFGELLARSANLSHEDLDRELHMLQSTGPSTIDTLSVPAFNQNLITNGYANCVLKESRWQRFVSFLA